MPRGTLTPSTPPFLPTAFRFSRGLFAGIAGFAFLGFSDLSAAESPPQYQPTTPLPIWPDLAPGEATRHPGQLQPFRVHEKPPVIRVEKITHPLLDVFLPEESPTGAGVLILPGGGFGKVVTNKEGTEAATWLNELGIAAFVLSYRTISPNESRAWYRPLQDSQRALRLIRSRAEEWGLDPEKIGLLGFSAGGQVAAIHLANQYQTTYPPLDPVDSISAYPNFALLIYPWNTLDGTGSRLRPEFQFRGTPPATFLVHTHDDGSSSIGTVQIYTALKQHKIPAALHIYPDGGHGYGMRSVPGSAIGTWPDRATSWLRSRGLARPQEKH